MTVRARNISGNVVQVAGARNIIVPDLIRETGSSLIAFSAESAGNMVSAGCVQNAASSASATDAATMATGNKVVGCVPSSVNVA